MEDVSNAMGEVNKQLASTGSELLKNMTEQERTLYGFPARQNHDTMGATVGSISYNLLGERGLADYLTMLPKPALLSCIPPYVRLFQDDFREFVTGDDLRRLGKSSRDDVLLDA